MQTVLMPAFPHGREQFSVPSAIKSCLDRDVQFDLHGFLIIGQHTAEFQRLGPAVSEQVVDNEEVPGVVRLQKRGYRLQNAFRRSRTRFALDRTEFAIHAATTNPADRIDFDFRIAQEIKVGQRQCVEVGNRRAELGLNEVAVLQKSDPGNTIRLASGQSDGARLFI